MRRTNELQHRSSRVNNAAAAAAAAAAGVAGVRSPRDMAAAAVLSSDVGGDLLLQVRMYYSLTIGGYSCGYRGGDLLLQVRYGVVCV